MIVEINRKIQNRTMMIHKSVVFIFINVCVLFTHSHTTQMPSRSDPESESSPFIEVAQSFLEEALSSQNSGRGDNGNGMAGIAQLIGSLMQPSDSGKSNNGGFGAAQILSGIGSLLASSNGGRNGGGGSGFDPSLIGSVLEMFTSNTDSDDGDSSATRKKRSNSNQDGIGIETLVNLASVFMGNANNVDSESNGKNEGLMNLLPMIVQAVNSFSGQEGERVLAKHKDHQWVLPPFLERIHVMWDHFSNSELAEALWAKSGINAIFKVRFFFLLESPVIFMCFSSSSVAN